MVKKHLITCSVIFVLVVISGLIAYSYPLLKPRKSARTATANRPAVKAIFIKDDTTAVDDFNFADEYIPVNDPRVDRKISLSLRLHSHKHIQSNILQIKAEKLFPIIEPILKFYGIPDDFKYVPLVESGLDGGKSARGAKGIWQFMAGTARTYGLKVNKDRDDRQNVQKSTIAACKYIKELYSMYNSWTMAAAAYNLGEIKLNKAIRKQKEDNYYRMHLNRETGTYVYKLIAMKEIITQPRKYGYRGEFATSKNNFTAINTFLAAN